MKHKTFLISGGGTGGHIFPAVAIAQTIMYHYPEATVIFVGAKGRMEMEKVPAAGFKIHGLWISGFQRNKIWKNILLPFKIIYSLGISWWLIRKYKPLITIGVGGYASGPLNFMASLMGKKVLLQEQNSYPGITNKLLQKRASVICVAYEGMERFFEKHKLVLTGNPIRQELLQTKPALLEARKYFSVNTEKFTILIIGGSLGAPAINKTIQKILPNLMENEIQIIWQTGKNTDVEHGNFDFGLCTPFIQRMDLAYAASNIVVSRAGALAISEMTALGKASILVPSPYVAENHQLKNAQALVSQNAALLCEEKNLSQELLPMMVEMKSNKAKLKEIALNSENMGQTKATELIFNQIAQLI
jgi:UDP-N-acetylglucosamine--N-acetylmuramyl-(pentapeptide) pyrophosphoryl-undecaprenol N-acetylglucosamine transferase